MRVLSLFPCCVLGAVALLLSVAVRADDDLDVVVEDVDFDFSAAAAEDPEDTPAAAAARGPVLSQQGTDKSSNKPTPVPPSTPTKATSASRPFFYSKSEGLKWAVIQEHYLFDVTCLMFAALMVANYVQGKAQNRKIALSLVDSLQDLLEQQFAEVGVSGITLLEMAPHIYKLYCTGRRGISHMNVVVTLKPRQDAFARFVLCWFQNAEGDKISVEMGLESLDVFCLSICRKRFKPELEKKFSDLEAFAKARKVGGLPEQLLCLSDNLDVAEQTVVKSTVKDLPKDALMHFQWLYGCCGSDGGALQQALPSPFLLAELTMPAKPHIIEDLMTSVLTVADALTRVKLSESSRAKALKDREEAKAKSNREDEATRMERIEQKRIEKKRQDDERLLKMTPEQQRKEEARNYKKELKNRMPKMKMQK